MSGKIFAAVCALLFVQLAVARVVREAPAEATNPLTDLLSKASDALKDVQGKVFEAVGVKNQEQFNDYVLNESKLLVSKLDTLAKDLKTTADESVDKVQNSDALKQLRSSVDEAIVNLKKENPNAATNIDQLTKSAQGLIEGISKIGDSESAKQIKELGNKILETTVDALKDVSNKIQETSKSK